MTWLLAVLLSLVGGAPSDEPAIVITLERTTCFGTCPAYSVRISGDGRVDYEGKRFVRVIGHATTTIEPQAVADLAAEFNRIGYFALVPLHRDRQSGWLDEYGHRPPDNDDVDSHGQTDQGGCRLRRRA